MRNDKAFWDENHINENNNMSLSNYSVIADDLPVLLCRFRKDGSIIFVNDSYAKFFNTSKDVLIGTKFFISADEFEKTGFSNPFLNKYKKQFSLQLSDNSIHWIEWTVNRISDRNSEGFEYQAIGQDISEHKLLEEHLTKISVAVDQSNSTVVITDTEGNIEYVNPRFTKITGYTADEAKGKNTRILKSDKNDAKVYADMWSTITKGDEWQGELLNKKKNGELFWELVTISPVKNDNGIITNYIAIKEDISDFKKSEKLEKTLYQISRAIIDNQDLDSLYSSIHKSLSEILPVENFFIAIYDKKKNLLSFPYFVDEYDEPYETEPPGKGLTEYVLRTGKPLHVDQAIFKTLVEKGEVDLVGTDSLDWIGVPLKIGEDIFGVLVVQTYSEKRRLDENDLNVLIYVSDQIALAIERTRTNNLLKSSEERYKLLFDKAADLILIINPTGTVLDINNIFELETGYKRNELIGKNIFHSGLLTSKSSVSTAFYLSRLMIGKDVPIFEIDGIKKDGDNITYELRAVPILEKEELIGVQAILRNISDRKKTEAKLHHSEKQLSNLMSSLPGMAYRSRYDINWTMEFVSQGCLDLTGFTADELTLNSKISYAELIHPEDKENVFITIRESINKKAPYQLVYRIRTKSGAEKWAWEKGTAQVSKKGKVETLEGFVTDISARVNTESALKESEELYKKLIATLPDIITITDINGEILFLNDIGIKFSGHKNFEEVKNKNIMGFIAQKDKDKGFRNFKNALTKKIGPQEYNFVNSKGEEFLFEVHREVLRSFDESPYGLIFSMRDITSRKKAEIELAQSEEKYRTLIDSIQDGVFLIVDGILLFVNKAFSKMIGYENGEIEGVSFLKFVAPEDVELVVGNYKLRQEGKLAPSSYEWRMLHKNGSKVFVNMSARVISYQGKKATIGTLKDITHQKKLEQILLNQKNLFKGVADAANILLTERNFDLAISNTLKSLGQSSDIDRVYIFENHFDSNSSEPLLSQKYEWTNGKVSPEIDNPEMQNLKYFPMFESWYPILNNGGTVNNLVKDLNPELKNLLSIQGIKSILLVPIMVNNQFWGFIGFDYCQSERIWSESEISILQTTAANLGGIIERETTKKELIDAKNTAEEMSKLKSIFLANMSHEIRTPLIAILGYTEILKSEVEHQEWNDMITTIMQSGKRLMETLNLLLDLSKVEADKVQTNYNEINIAEEVTEVVIMLGPVAQKKNLYLKSKIEKDVVLSKLDKRLLHSIITNLVNNAIKYTNTGGITVELSTINSNGIDYAMIRVVDTGIGIAKEDQENVFEEFRQVSEGYNRHFEGAGLGLTISKKFAEKMGGSISLESEVGKGSTFTVVFQAEGEGVKSKPINTMTNENILPSPLRKRRKVLVVDDDIATRNIVELFLRGEIELESASNSEEATDLINKEVYSVVLMDISLGKGISGVELLKNVRTLPQYKNVPIIAVTAHAMVGDKEKFLSSGFDDYLSKPFGKKDLINKVRSWVAHGNSIGKS
ncbi:MAG: PAS domain S-box protein [Ignavibacteriales bacterium]|nr:PAS domain S-box protein [Ignavibacteriales bacterium]